MRQNAALCGNGLNALEEKFFEALWVKKKEHLTSIFFFSNHILYTTKDKVYAMTLPNNKILASTKLKAFVDDKYIVAKMIISVFDRVDIIVGKRENIFPTMLSKVFSGGGVVKSCDCVVKS